MTNVLMVISGVAKPGSLPQVHQSFQRHLAPRAEQNPAQPLVIWAADSNTPDRFMLVEVYNHPDAVTANAQADWFWAYLAEVGPLLDGDPTVTTYEPRWAKGLDLGP